MNNFFRYILIDTGAYRLTVGMVLGAVLIILAAKIILLLFKNIFTRKTRNKPHHEERHHSIYLLLKYLVWVVSFTFCLEAIGVQVTILLAGSAALLVGVGLGIQQTFNDIISGIIILLEGSLNVNDVVEVEGLVGKVINISIRTSEVYTRDGIYIIVPNHKFTNENVINWSHNTKATRFKIVVGVAYESNEEQVKNILMDCLNEHPKVIKDNEQYSLSIRLSEFGDNALNFELLFWADDIFFIERIKSDIRFIISKKFREAGIKIPFPQRDIHIIN